LYGSKVGPGIRIISPPDLSTRPLPRVILALLIAATPLPLSSATAASKSDMARQKPDESSTSLPRAAAEQKTAIIIGAGPAGLTAAYELLIRTNIKPIVLERSNCVGGICRTAMYKGNRIDIGGHRFFSKSDRVMNWWLAHMPLEQISEASPRIAYHRMSREIPGTGSNAPFPPTAENVMLLRSRKSRIYFLRKFFDYPITLSFDTVRKLGLRRTVRSGFSYLRSALFPLRDARNLEQFFINRFGRELYQTFFKSYTEKVWGVPCHAIGADWGEQRIKGLSIGKTVSHALRKYFRGAGEETETSLIEHFLYPRRGPGQMWELVAEKISQLGGAIHTGRRVSAVSAESTRVAAVRAINPDGRSEVYHGDYFFSTMPVKDLISAIDGPVPENVREVSAGLLYRDFIIVGLLVKKLSVAEKNNASIEDNWIYVQEPEVRTARLQIFNNWSPDLVADPSKVWLGAEYFCQEADDLWKLTDAEMAQFATRELEKIGILSANEVLDSVVIRMPKTYPAYFGTYHRFAEVREFLDRFENLFPIGRNGMHRYNNQDHSMLTAMLAVDNILSGRLDKSNLWEVNTEMEYHESAKAPADSL
jgi:protoporphyrinogen oxidase